MCSWRSAVFLARPMGWRVRLGGVCLLGMCILGRESEESLALQRDEARVSVGEEVVVASEGDGRAGWAGVGTEDCSLDCLEASSSTTDL